MQAAGRRQKMQAIQCNDPFESKSETMTIQGKKTVSIDFYDIETAFMLKRVLDKLCNEKDVSLTVYGANLYHIEFKIDNNECDIMNRVSKGLCRICTRVASVPYKSDIMKPCDMIE